MYYLISILILITCVLLVFVVLVQNSKGGGLASNFSSSNQIMGVRKTGDFLEKATWSLAIALLVLCLSSNFFLPNKEGVTKDTELREQLDKTTPPPAQTPPPQQPAKGQQQQQPAQPAGNQNQDEDK